MSETKAEQWQGNSNSGLWRRIALDDVEYATTDYLNALEERVRAAEARLTELPVCASCGYFKVLSEGGWCPSCVALAESETAQLYPLLSARQAAEGRAVELEKVADVMRPSREIAAAKAALADEIREWLSGDAFSGSPTAAADYRKARVDWLARYDALLSFPVPAARDGEAEQPEG